MLLSLATTVALAMALAPQTPPSAATVTEPGRTLARPLDIVVGAPLAEGNERTLLVVLDPSQGLAEAAFADAFAAAIAANAGPMAHTAIGLAVVGEKDLVVAPTLAHGEVVRAIAASCGLGGRCSSGGAQPIQSTSRAVGFGGSLATYEGAAKAPTPVFTSATKRRSWRSCLRSFKTTLRPRRSSAVASWPGQEKPR